ncbi:TlpA family protein disulfide reductase [Aquimarina sp. AD10]|uniref:TlpA family protein disulfide reductase n=1 Tax=Aquimarina sp. AD10 TaxID=1714849 RepID=UPI000E553C84|nr:TlpA disulfide reductase family protein [Aquimarina sp. AD10]AXT60480.1 TlpA family protein disulfide reductase [Aquimarina sp. AD10]RKM96965.1 TlpA family protein disulfide reductase [Aquimarina sp. AD10]
MNKLLLSGLILLFLSCNKNKGVEKSIETGDFSVVMQKKIALGGKTNYTFRTLDSIPKELKAVPELDTVKLQYLIFRSSLEPDSIVPNKIYAYSGYDQGKFVISYDLNFNKDLTDDKKYYFDRPYGKWTRKDNYRKNIPYDTIQYLEYKEGNVIKDSLIYRVVPNDSTAVNPNDASYVEQVLKMDTYNHWWYGEFILNNEKYKTSIQPSSFLKTSITYSKLNEDFPQREDYDFVDTELKDTIEIENSYYRIDSISNDFSELFLKDLKIKERSHGVSSGEKIKDFKFNDIRFRSLSFSQLLVDKDYLLIDFWGTWCAPCLKLNPSVLKINNEHASQLSILSFAYDDKRNKVFEHVKEYQMDWNHVFLQRDLKDGTKTYPKILKELKIEAFPTFILLDKNRNILVRGTGEVSLNKIKEILLEKDKT